MESLTFKIELSNGLLIKLNFFLLVDFLFNFFPLCFCFLPLFVVH